MAKVVAGLIFLPGPSKKTNYFWGETIEEEQEEELLQLQKLREHFH